LQAIIKEKDLIPMHLEQETCLTIPLQHDSSSLDL